MKFTLNEYHRNVSDEELLGDILQVAKKLGKATLTRKEYKENGGKYSYSTIANRFGGWIKALDKCGLIPNDNQLNNQTVVHNHKRKDISNYELIDDIKKASLLLNKATFSSEEYNRIGSFSKNLVLRRFKTWNNALAASGLKPYEVPSGVRIDEYSLLNEIERMWIELGRQPTTTDIKQGYSKYSLHAYERRFGSWRKALEAFIAYMNGELEVEEKGDNDEIIIPLTIDGQSQNDRSSHMTNRSISLRQRFLVMKRDNFKCCMCGRSPATTPGLELHIDHIIPWSKGGETVIDNLQTLCSDCNLGKSDLSVDET